MTFTPSRLRGALSDGLLSFPITDFDAEGRFSPDSYRDRIAGFVEHGVSAVFVAGGTGEFFSLSLEEYRQICDIAVETVAGRVPVVASAGRSVADALQFTSAAERARCDGILLMPPYLTECPAEGVSDYAEAVIQKTSLPVIYYSRANGTLGAEPLSRLAERCPGRILAADLGLLRLGRPGLRGLRRVWLVHGGG